MLTSLEIENYRNFKHLTIEKLGRVNLIIGKNNTGKSSLLEAVSIFAMSKLYPSNNEQIHQWLYYLASQRDENYTLRIQNSNIVREVIDKNIKTITSLMYERKIDFNIDFCTIIGDPSSGNKLRIRLAKEYQTQAQNLDENGQLMTHYYQKVALRESEIANGFPFTEVFEIQQSTRHSGSIISAIPLRANNQGFASQIQSMLPAMKLQIVWTNNNNAISLNAILWDKILFEQSKINSVVSGLRIIEPNIEIIAFPSNEHNQRYAAIKTTNGNDPIPASSMGDGINRVLTIILAMVNCQDGYFLVDEFDMGLHHSVQKKLWEIVFYLANKLNVQVFATTHSHDTIKTFQAVANGKAEYEDAILVKLVNKQGNIEAITANANELEEIVEDLIDIR